MPDPISLPLKLLRLCQQRDRKVIPSIIRSLFPWHRRASVRHNLVNNPTKPKIVGQAGSFRRTQSIFRSNSKKGAPPLFPRRKRVVNASPTDTDAPAAYKKQPIPSRNSAYSTSFQQLFAGAGIKDPSKLPLGPPITKARLMIIQPQAIDGYIAEAKRAFGVSDDDPASYDKLSSEDSGFLAYLEELKDRNVEMTEALKTALIIQSHTEWNETKEKERTLKEGQVKTEKDCDEEKEKEKEKKEKKVVEDQVDEELSPTSKTQATSTPATDQTSPQSSPEPPTSTHDSQTGAADGRRPGRYGCRSNDFSQHSADHVDPSTSAPNQSLQEQSSSTSHPKGRPIPRTCEGRRVIPGRGRPRYNPYPRSKPQPQQPMSPWEKWEKLRRAALEEEARRVEAEGEARMRSQAAMEARRRKAQEEQEAVRQYLQRETEAAWHRQQAEAQAAHALEVERQRLEAQQRQQFIASAFNSYDRNWAALRTRQEAQSGQLLFHQFPWPIFPSTANIVPKHINIESVRKFVLWGDRPGWNDKTPKQRINAELLHWHPDKLDDQVLRQVHEQHLSQVKQTADLVVRILNNLKAEAQD